ncbi:SRF-like protein [Agrocybe pediades]|nr:SRF-like protein [Agrocybe pediades]
MGRRKIEIQPITHERNRSVTFLKRKNGLFKKAYELGVLCSVDVAVIIFEARPGHEARLHQYCSGDIRDIVQRHVRHQGEKDLKGPADFSNSGPSGIKFDDNDDGDDMEDDELDQQQHPHLILPSQQGMAMGGSVPSRASRKRRASNMGDDLDGGDVCLFFLLHFTFH